MDTIRAGEPPVAIGLTAEEPQLLQTTTPSSLMQNEVTVVRRAGRQAVRHFLESHHCFAVLRTSGKVVVFDTRIPIQLAFYALVEHGEFLLLCLMLLVLIAFV